MPSISNVTKTVRHNIRQRHETRAKAFGGGGRGCLGRWFATLRECFRRPSFIGHWMISGSRERLLECKAVFAAIYSSIQTSVYTIQGVR